MKTQVHKLTIQLLLSQPQLPTIKLLHQQSLSQPPLPQTLNQLPLPLTQLLPTLPNIHQWKLSNRDMKKH